MFVNHEIHFHIRTTMEVSGIEVTSYTVILTGFVNDSFLKAPIDLCLKKGKRKSKYKYI